jgi:YegS/Rv2252/BmrU family lipid kinase
VKIWVLVNPRAGSGRSRARALAFLEGVPEAELVETTQPGGAVEMARRAVLEEVDVLVAVGGDGTLQQCATGLCLDQDGRATQPKTALLILPAGTGGDYRRSLSLSESVDQAVARLAQPQTLAVDVGRVEMQADGRREVAAFMNVVSFGIGGLTDRLVAASPKWLGGKLTYLWGATRATLLHQPTAVELWIDDQLVETAPFANVAICLGQYFGAGMRIAPQADLSDGLFDIVTIEMGKLRTLSLSAFIYQGTHLQKAGVCSYQGRSIVAKAVQAERCLVDADGEPLGTLPLRVDLLPRALTLYI